MDFALSKEDLEVRSRMAEFAVRELNDEVTCRDREERFPRAEWNKCAEFGLLGLAVPAEYGGANDVNIVTAMLALEGLGYGCRDNGLAFAINGQFLVKMALLHLGTESQKQAYLPEMCQGKLMGTFAFTEPDHGSDLAAIQTRAEKCTGGYTLTGTKRFITFAPIMDFAVLLASTNPDLGQWGLTAFLVKANTPGFAIGAPRKKMGLRTVPQGDLTLTNCVVSTDAVLGSEGSGMGIVNSSLEWERCCLLASQLGAMERQLEDCIRYARERKQFGRPIGKFQSVSNRIVDMKLRLETARLLLYRTGWLKLTGQNAMMDAAMAKLYLSECFVKSSLDAIRIHGGNGYMCETGVERDLRDAIGGTIYGGTSDIQRNTIAGLLGL
jgi:alkylation response protein AidB-like acyl-CoA dehydrogenase